MPFPIQEKSIFICFVQFSYASCDEIDPFTLTKQLPGTVYPIVRAPDTAVIGLCFHPLAW